MAVSVVTFYMSWMPRGRPKTLTALRLDPALMEAVRRYTDNLTGAVEEGLAWWLKRAKRQATAPHSEAKPQPRQNA
jgi:hypothetical protein